MITSEVVQGKKYKLAIVGSRTIAAKVNHAIEDESLKKELEAKSKKDSEFIINYVEQFIDKISLVISGGALGVDSIAQEIAKKHGLPILIIYPKWYGPHGNYLKGGGFSRNVQIVKESDAVLAFQRDESRGTQHDIDLAKKYNKMLRVIKM